eukprot:5886412-Pyramimonas_sp.AAC.1
MAGDLRHVDPRGRRLVRLQVLRDVLRTQMLGLVYQRLRKNAALHRSTIRAEPLEEHLSEKRSLPAPAQRDP